MLRLLILNLGVTIVCAVFIAGAVFAGQSLRGDLLAVVVSRQGVVCGAREQVYNIALLDVDHQLLCYLSGLNGHAVFQGWSPDGRRFVVEAGGTLHLAEATTRPATIVMEESRSGAWSSTGQIAFESWRDGNLDIYVMEGDGSNVHNMTNSAPSERLPAWSSDGSQLVYLCGEHICTIDAAGGEVRLLAGTRTVEYAVQWWPDNSAIVFVGQDPVGDLQAHVIDADGSRLRLFDRRYSITGMPAFAPAGDQVAFFAYSPKFEIMVYIMDIASGEAKGLYRHATASEGRSLAWSPDGKRLAFEMRSVRDEVYVADLDTGVVHLLCQGCEQPHWRPR